MGSSEIQGKLWGAEAKDYTEFTEPGNKSLWEVMLASAKVGKDTRFLDAGCGAGGALLPLSQLAQRGISREPWVTLRPRDGYLLGVLAVRSHADQAVPERLVHVALVLGAPRYLLALDRNHVRVGRWELRLHLQRL